MVNDEQILVYLQRALNETGHHFALNEVKQHILMAAQAVHSYRKKQGRNAEILKQQEEKLKKDKQKQLQLKKIKEGRLDSDLRQPPPPYA